MRQYLSPTWAVLTGREQGDGTIGYPKCCVSGDVCLWISVSASVMGLEVAWCSCSSASVCAGTYVFPLCGECPEPFTKELRSCSQTQGICKRCKQSGRDPKGEIEAKRPHKAISSHLEHTSEPVAQWGGKYSPNAPPVRSNIPQLRLYCKCCHWAHTGSKDVMGYLQHPALCWLRLAVFLQPAKDQRKDKGSIKTSHVAGSREINSSAALWPGSDWFCWCVYRRVPLWDWSTDSAVGHVFSSPCSKSDWNREQLL